MDLPALQEPSFQVSWDPIRAIYYDWVRLNEVLNENEDPESRQRWEVGQKLYTESIYRPTQYNSTYQLPVDPSVDTVAILKRSLQTNYRMIFYFMRFFIEQLPNFYAWVMEKAWTRGLEMIQTNKTHARKKEQQAEIIKKLQERIKICTMGVLKQFGPKREPNKSLRARWFPTYEQIDTNTIEIGMYPNRIPLYFGRDWMRKVLTEQDCHRNLQDLHYRFLISDPLIVAVMKIVCEIVYNHGIKLEMRDSFDGLDNLYNRVRNMAQARGSLRILYFENKDEMLELIHIVGDAIERMTSM